MTYIGFVAKTQKKDILNDKLYYVDSTFDHIFKGTCNNLRSVQNIVVQNSVFLSYCIV